MTCFWDGLIEGLNKSDYKRIGIKKPFKNADNIYGYLKKNNKIISDVEYQLGNLEVEITKKQQLENYDHINNYKFSRNGHNCSACDPFLILVASLFKVRIIHDGTYHKSTYTSREFKRTIWFNSNVGHFWHD